MDDAAYPSLAADERRDALQVAGRSTGRRTYVLEKDIWVVAILGVLFEAPFGQHLVFKGGTSLSKVWRAVRRFSEDIDITYDIRSFAPDLVAGAGEEALPPQPQSGEALDKGDPSPPRWVGPQPGRSAPRRGACTRRFRGTGSSGVRVPLRSLRSAVRAARDHASRGEGRLRSTLHGRAPSVPLGRVRCRCAPSGSCVSGGAASRHAGGAYVLGEGHGYPRLPSSGTAERRALVAALARPRSP